MITHDAITDRRIKVTDDLFFSERFDSAMLRGSELLFTEKQAGIVEALVMNYKATGFTSMKNRDLLLYIYSPANAIGKRVPDVFKVKVDGETRKHPAWGAILRPGKIKGTTRLML